MNSSVQAGWSAGVTSLEKMRAASTHRIGRIRLPPANTLYRMAVWIEGGCVVSAGSNRSRAASTAIRFSSKKGGSFIVGRKPAGQGAHQSSRFRLPLWIKRFRCQFAIRLFQKDFHAAFRLFKLLLTFPRQRDPFFKKFHGLVQRELRAFQSPHNLFEARERALEIGLLWSFGLFRCWYVHKLNLCSMAALISGTAGTSTSSVRSARCVESPLRTVGRVLLRGHRRAESSRGPETTIVNPESPAPGAGSILRHARERTQLLCAGAALPPASTIWRGGEGRVARARAIHTSTCFPDRRLAFGPAGNPSGDARTLQAVLAIARQWKLSKGRRCRERRDQNCRWEIPRREPARNGGDLQIRVRLSQIRKRHPRERHSFARWRARAILPPR